MATKERVCPFCSSAVKLYEISLEECLEMCSNVKCHYPFGEKNLDDIVSNLNHYDNLESENLSKKQDKDGVEELFNAIEFVSDDINCKEKTPTKPYPQNNVQDNIDTTSPSKTFHEQGSLEKRIGAESTKKVFFFDNFISKRKC